MRNGSPKGFKRRGEQEEPAAAGDRRKQHWDRRRRSASMSNSGLSGLSFCKPERSGCFFRARHNVPRSPGPAFQVDRSPRRTPPLPPPSREAKRAMSRRWARPEICVI
jgi:hypothetical protein